MNHDEYTDYSCSTSVERLARDVETILRNWHVTGSDRHVSFEHSHNPTSPYRKLASVPNLQSYHEQQEESPRNALQKHSSVRVSPKEHSTPPRHSGSLVYSRVKQDTVSSSAHAPSVRLIRSDSLVWVVSLADGQKVSVSLTLALWDGPASTKAAFDLPHSLRRLPFSSMPNDLFCNFSTLFGIGQHITLSPQNLEEKVTFALGSSVLQRHDTKTSQWVVTSVLSSLLQTALNVAVSNVQSRIPVFGIWGLYSPEQDQAHHDFSRINSVLLELLPKWTCRATSLPKRRRRLFSSSFSENINRHYISPIISANILPSQEMDSPTATFWVGILPRPATSQLSVWGKMLLRHCPASTTSVVLCGARHVYTWLKPKTAFARTTALFTSAMPDWRTPVTVEDAETIESFRQHCRQYAETIMENACGATSTEARWGPIDDPIASVHCTVTWKGPHAEPLISLPFVVRSRHHLSRQDRIDMEASVEQTLLDPTNPSTFSVQTHYDTDTSLTPLAASQRCILAALIRCATLPPEILLQHLTSEAVMDEWSSEVGERAAAELVGFANLNQHTQRLVSAMDWTCIADDMMEQWEADRMIQSVFDGTITLGFPSPPEEFFGPDAQHDQGIFASLQKSAPPGRLLSLLFLYMSRLHAPSSMALLWITFVRELRSCWDVKDSLPNMGYVPGLDPPPEELNVKRCFSTIGLKADHAAFVHSSEPDPDDSHCLIGQKLQAFNIGIEVSVAIEMQAIERIEKQQLETEGASQADTGETTSLRAPSVGSSTVIITNATKKDGDAANSASNDVPAMNPVQNKSSIGVESPDDGSHSLSQGNSSKDEFYDSTSILGDDHATSVVQRQHRKGARCPVHGVSLLASGDQMYAPYLQREPPMTDDVILERRAMMSNDGRDSKQGMLSVHERIEIAHFLQKPKLLSDMRAFKAANPGAIFQDFINWYGNPGNPLEDYDVAAEHAAVQPSELTNISLAVKLDNASTAIQILTATRDFFSDTWDEATPCPAIEQQPLFDVVSTVEMILDSFETMHPASLVNQIMAVNLSMAYFSLVSSAGETLQVETIQKSLETLREATNHALKLLSRDVTLGTCQHYLNQTTNHELLPKHASVQAIRACDAACNALATTEAMIARAMSILHKFPQQYELVQRVLLRADGESITVDHPQGRAGILDAIHGQQSSQESFPAPCLREYILRNTDEANPCQLCVRFGDGKGAFEGMDGGVMVALTKSYRD